MKKVRLAGLVLTVFLIAVARPAAAEEAPPQGVLSAKVVDVAIFKTGSGIFRYEGEGIVKDGRLILAETPSPAFGTLWFYALDDGVVVESVEARDVYRPSERPVAGALELVCRNAGKRAKVVMKDWSVEGTILPNAGGGEIPLKTENGVMAVKPDELRYVEIADAASAVESRTKSREMSITLRGAKEGQKVRIAYNCLEQGIRWLPSYRIDLEGQTAHMALAAAVINDVADLAGARASFVVGQPVFTLASVLAPVAQSNKDIQLGEFFKQEAANALGVQVSYGRVPAEQHGQARSYDLLYSGAASLEAQVAVETIGTQVEHLFYYTAENVSVAKDTSSSVVIMVADDPVEHVFVWDVPNIYIYQNPDYAKRLREIYNGGFFTKDTVEDKSKDAVKYSESESPVHCLKMKNETGQPWAAAPVLISEEGRALSQVWLDYTAADEETKVTIGPAVDIKTRTAEREVKREIGSGTKGSSSDKTDLITVEGYLVIENKRAEKATLAVTRNIVGTVLVADNKCEITAHRAGGSVMNSTATLKWTVDVKPAEKMILTYRFTRSVSH